MKMYEKPNKFFCTSIEIARARHHQYLPKIKIKNGRYSDGIIACMAVIHILRAHKIIINKKSKFVRNIRDTYTKSITSTNTLRECIPVRYYLQTLFKPNQCLRTTKDELNALFVIGTESS